MPKRPTAPASKPPDRYFAKELAGDTAPSFSVLQRLYKLAYAILGFAPWRMLDESQLIVVRDSVSGELCYCSVMGALGEVYSIHVYIGAAGLRLFRRMEAEEIEDAGEFFATQHSVSVEFVPRTELEKQDRELLAALGHPKGKGIACPIFRTIRPGFYPWFVTEEEARTLTECLRAVIAVCEALVIQDNPAFWEVPDTYPLVTLLEEAWPQHRIEPFEAVLPAEQSGPPAAHPVGLDEEALRSLRSQNYAVRGAMELDHIFTGTAVGKKGERSAYAVVALAVDAESGMILAPETTDSRSAPADTLARVFLRAVKTSGTLPKEVRVRNQNLKDCLTPFMESFGVAVRVADTLPAADEARSSLLSMLQARFQD